MPLPRSADVVAEVDPDKVRASSSLDDDSGSRWLNRAELPAGDARKAAMVLLSN
jgi:hypothetical protein